MDVANQALALPGSDIPSLGELLGRQAASLPGAIAFSCGDQQLGFARLEALSSALAQWLTHDLACAPGTRVALQLPNRCAFPVLAMAVFKAALVLVNISIRASSRERDAMLRDSGARLLFCQAQGMVAVRVPGIAVHDAEQALAQTFPAFRGLASRPPVCGRNTLALLQYTGGSSGQLRAAMLTHGNLLANLGQLHERLGEVYPPAGACMLAPLPFSHIYAFTLGMLGGIYYGHHAVLLPDPGDVPALTSDGWLRTGDIGVLDAGGCLHLQGRSTDMVIVGGFKVWPQEVENCLLRHPRVQDACVLGYGPAHQQGLAAFVVAEGGLNGRALRGWCAEFLAAYKLPRRIEFLSRLPRSSAGKLQRQRLQRSLADI